MLNVIFAHFAHRSVLHFLIVVVSTVLFSLRVVTLFYCEWKWMLSIALYH